MATTSDGPPALQDSTGGVQHGGSHYRDFAIQPIDYAEANKLTPTQFSLVKYASRFLKAKGMLDLKKLIHFAQMAALRHYGVRVEVTYHEPATSPEKGNG